MKKGTIKKIVVVALIVVMVVTLLSLAIVLAKKIMSNIDRDEEAAMTQRERFAYDLTKSSVEVIWYGDDAEYTLKTEDGKEKFFLDDELGSYEIPLRKIDTINKENLKKSDGYKYSVIVVNNIYENITLTDEEYASIANVLNKDSKCIFVWCGEEDKEKLVKYGFINSFMSYGESLMFAFYHNKKTGDIIGDFGMYVRSDLTGGHALIDSLLYHVTSIINQ